MENNPCETFELQLLSSFQMKSRKWWRHRKSLSVESLSVEVTRTAEKMLGNAKMTTRWRKSTDRPAAPKCFPHHLRHPPTFPSCRQMVCRILCQFQARLRTSTAPSGFWRIRRSSPDQSTALTIWPRCTRNLPGMPNVNRSSRLSARQPRKGSTGRCDKWSTICLRRLTFTTSPTWVQLSSDWILVILCLKHFFENIYSPAIFILEYKIEILRLFLCDLRRMALRHKFRILKCKNIFFFVVRENTILNKF